MSPGGSPGGPVAVFLLDFFAGFGVVAVEAGGNFPDFREVLFGEVFVSRYDSLQNNQSVFILFRNNGFCKFFKFGIGFCACVVKKFKGPVIPLAGAEGLFPGVA